MASRRHYERTTPLLPPRRRNWKPGTYQLGLFIRTASGITLECVRDTATEAEAKALQDLWFGASSQPEASRG